MESRKDDQGLPASRGAAHVPTAATRGELTSHDPDVSVQEESLPTIVSHARPVLDDRTTVKPSDPPFKTGFEPPAPL